MYGSDVVKIITLLPGGLRECNAWKINARIKANVRGFWATLGELLLCNRTSFSNYTYNGHGYKSLF
jgi:hypothetical protein